MGEEEDRSPAPKAKTKRVQREASRDEDDRSPPPKAKAKAPEPKEPVREMIRVDDLPPDMTRDEFFNTCSTFGEVLSAKVSEKGGNRFGIAEFKTTAALDLAVKKLDQRRVEGWEKRLRACVVEQDS